MKGRPTSSARNNSRRAFLQKSAMASAALAMPDLSLLASSRLLHRSLAGEIPWFKKITRWGQVNITEKDPLHYDIDWWRGFWKRTQTQGVIVNAGGIVAYYPTKVALHRPAQYLNGIDLFGDICRAAQADGLAVFARMDSNRAHEDFYNAHPDWFALDAEGKPYKAADLFITCVNSPYYSEHIPAILREIAELYHPEGFTDNSWSGLGRDSICYCANCKKSFLAKTGKEIPTKKNWDDQTYCDWIRWNYDRRLEIWDLNNKTTRAAGGIDCIWSGMQSGSIAGQCRSFRDYKAVTARADIIMLDDQARRDNAGFQHNAQVGKLIHGMLGWDKLIPESMAMYQTHRPWFRLASKPEREARMWVIEGIAGGIQPWWHMIAASHDDRRMYQSVEGIFNWHKKNEVFLINRQPVATIGIVWSQENYDFYGRDQAEQLVEQPIRGIMQALVRGRIPFIFVHADDIEREGERLSLLVLPNLAVMSPKQIASVRKFVGDGGNLIATGETSLYNEWGVRQSDFGLADVFGVHAEKVSTENTAPLPKLGGDNYHTYLRLTPEIRGDVDGPKSGTEPVASGQRSPIFQGFEQTDIIPFGGLLQALKVDKQSEVLMTFVPQFPVYPPETAWMREAKTTIPGLVVSTKARGSRVAFLVADLDRQFDQFNLPDHGNLLANVVRWAAKDNIPLTVAGTGMIDCNLYRQSERLVLHLVNLTNSATWRAPLDEMVPIGPLKVRVKLPQKIRAKNVQLLVSGQHVGSVVTDDWAQFEIKSVLDHEVAVIS
jgi:Hypothetical glycosyl hydrolase 6